MQFNPAFANSGCMKSYCRLLGPDGEVVPVMERYEL